MKPYVNKKITKNLIIIFVIVLITNSLLPNFVQAKTDTESGGGLLAPLEQFIVFLCDKVMEWLQNTFTSPESIDLGGGDYDFRYSPAIIFSGTVPALDINFIDPIGESTTTFNFVLPEGRQPTADEWKQILMDENLTKSYFRYYGKYQLLGTNPLPSYSNITQVTEDCIIDTHNIDTGEDEGEKHKLEYYGLTQEVFNQSYRIIIEDGNDFDDWYDGGYRKFEDEFTTSEEQSKFKGMLKHYDRASNSFSIRVFWVYNGDIYSYEGVDAWNNSAYIYRLSLKDAVVDKAKGTTTVKTIEEYESTAKKLQKTIATWYKALRRIALVGLLSVLVYIGIRMVMTSASQEKAKYKKMMVDWLAALCLLFTLHYIMNITLTITQEISNVFVTGESDVLLNKLRGEVRRGSSWGEVLAKTIMYVVLVIYTVTFTFRYIKRVIYMAFYTLIAPLITLTYPLDKIKDGQAQAFNMWIKEYVFTALIQVVHLVIYSVLVGSAIELVDNYELYAIIVIMFIKQAEDIIKKMFGFDKSETVGTLGAAATGGLLMSAINKMQTPPRVSGGKGGASGETPKGVRTASNSNVFASLQSGGSPNAPAPNTPAPNTPAPNTPAPNTPAPNTPAPNTPAPNAPATNTPAPNTPAPNTPAPSTQTPKRNIGSGIWKVAGRYTRPIVSKGAGLLVGGAGAMV